MQKFTSVRKSTDLFLTPVKILSTFTENYNIFHTEQVKISSNVNYLLMNCIVWNTEAALEALRADLLTLI